MSLPQLMPNINKIVKNMAIIEEIGYNEKQITFCEVSAFLLGENKMKDVLDSNLQAFIKNILPAPDGILADMMRYAQSNHISVVEPEVGNLLNLLVHLLKPQQILEVGTAIGVSTLYMARAMADYTTAGQIRTIELKPERAQLAQENFQKAQLASYIHLQQGDAREILPQLDESYDMIFLDAAKGQYEDFLTVSQRILRPGGLIVADNVLLNGWVVNLDYPTHRQKTFVLRMRALLESFRQRQDWQCSLLPLGDGVALLQKKENENAD